MSADLALWAERNRIAEEPDLVTDLAGTTARSGSVIDGPLIGGVFAIGGGLLAGREGGGSSAPTR